MGFLCVVPVAAFIAIKQKRRIEQTLAVSIFGIILLIYLSGLFTSFLPGVLFVTGILRSVCRFVAQRDHYRMGQCSKVCYNARLLLLFDSSSLFFSDQYGKDIFVQR